MVLGPLGTALRFIQRTACPKLVCRVSSVALPAGARQHYSKQLELEDRKPEDMEEEAEAEAEAPRVRPKRQPRAVLKAK